MAVANKYKIAVIEPSPIIRQGIKVLLDVYPSFEVVLLYSNFESFQNDSKHTSCDVVLINPSLISFYRQFSVKSLFAEQYDGVIVALLYGYVDAETIASFDGVIDIYDDGERIVKKLQKIIETTQHEDNNSNGDTVDLSDREKEILVSLTQGMTNKEIAEKHFISIHTVISHRKNITRKTGIKTVSGLTLYALFNNLISQEDI